MTVCAIDIGISGSVYPSMNSEALSGEVKSLSTKLVDLSFEISIDEKSEIKLSPKTDMPGARF